MSGSAAATPPRGSPPQIGISGVPPGRSFSKNGAARRQERNGPFDDELSLEPQAAPAAGAAAEHRDEDMDARRRLHYRTAAPHARLFATSPGAGCAIRIGIPARRLQGIGLDVSAASAGRSAGRAAATGMARGGQPLPCAVAIVGPRHLQCSWNTWISRVHQPIELAKRRHVSRLMRCRSRRR